MKKNNEEGRIKEERFAAQAKTFLVKIQTYNVCVYLCELQPSTTNILDEKCTDSVCTHQTENSDNFQKSGGLTPARRVEKNEGFGRSERVADESVEVEALTKHPHIGRTLEIQAQEGKELTIHLQEPVSRLSVKRFLSYQSSQPRADDRCWK